MNANELADKLLEDLREADLFNLDSVNYGNRKHYIDQLESVVRQQQAEIEALKKQLYPTPKEFIGVSKDGLPMFKEERNDAGFYMSDAEHYKLKCASQQAEIEAVKESNKNLMELVTMLREEVNSLRQQQAENEALKTKLQLHEAMDKQCESLMRQIKKDDDDLKGTREMTTFTTQDRQDAQRAPLTDEEIMNLTDGGGEWECEIGKDRIIEFARAIERAHGIGE